MADFNSTNETLGSLVVSIYLLGFAAGPLVIAPLSEMYGRMPLYHSCNTIFAAFTVACALAPSMNSLIALRFLQGCAGSAPLAIGGGTISDLIPQERRGKYMGIYALGPTLGPIFGPVVSLSLFLTVFFIHSSKFVQFRSTPSTTQCFPTCLADQKDSFTLSMTMLTSYII